ncbi:MAG TPA: hypothetical protein VFB45_07965 [Pseudolabrys sp.]|nr:hypothetical protein [Pseudolabrys sp.]
MDYDAIDAQIKAWADRHGLTLFTVSGGHNARGAHLSSKSGESFRIWIDPPSLALVYVHAGCLDGRRENELPRSWSARLHDLEATLDEALRTVIEWMLPSERHDPATVREV